MVLVVLEGDWDSASPGSMTLLLGSFALHPRVTRLEATCVQRSGEREESLFSTVSAPRGFRAGHRP